MPLAGLWCCRCCVQHASGKKQKHEAACSGSHIWVGFQHLVTSDSEMRVRFFHQISHLGNGFLKMPRINIIMLHKLYNLLLTFCTVSQNKLNVTSSVYWVLFYGVVEILHKVTIVICFYFRFC